MATFTKRMPEKTVNEVKDYLFDFSDLLVDSETLATKTVTPSSGLTVDSSALANSDTAVEVWVSGGTGDTAPTVCCEVVTSEGRTYERSMVIPVIEVCE